MLFEQLKAQKGFTPSEKAIADAIVNGAVKVETLSTTELAQATHTRKATVTRFCQKLGLGSYREFQQTLEKERAIAHDLDRMLQEVPINRNTGYDDVLRILPAFYQGTIYETTLGLNKQTVLRAASRLRAAKKVDIYGSGVTRTIAQLAAFKFSTLGIECSAMDGLNEHAILADRDPRQKAVIMLSFTGANANILHIAQWLKRRNYYILGIGGDARNGLQELCSDYIAVPQKQNVLGMEIIQSSNAVNYIIDILFSILLAKDYDYNRNVAAQLLER